MNTDKTTKVPDTGPVSASSSLPETIPAALVLEGGGMRGVYTTGVLDAFMDAGLEFPLVAGVSAGASHGLSFLSRQRDRARRVVVDYIQRPEYMGLRPLFTEGSYFGWDFIFRTLPLELEPFDFTAFWQNPTRWVAVATDIESGEPAYLSAASNEELMAVAKASCSLPFISPPVEINGHQYLDGGLSDSLPVDWALAQGAKKLIVIRTQPAGYRKGPTKHPGLARLWYRKHPALVEALLTRNERYNACLDHLDALERDGIAYVIQPKPQPGLARMERDPAKLQGLWESGYADGSAAAAKIARWRGAEETISL